MLHPPAGRLPHLHREGLHGCRYGAGQDRYVRRSVQLPHSPVLAEAAGAASTIVVGIGGIDIAIDARPDRRPRFPVISANPSMAVASLSSLAWNPDMTALESSLFGLVLLDQREGRIHGQAGEEKRDGGGVLVRSRVLVTMHDGVAVSPEVVPEEASCSVSTEETRVRLLHSLLFLRRALGRHPHHRRRETLPRRNEGPSRDRSAIPDSEIPDQHEETLILRKSRHTVSTPFSLRRGQNGRAVI